MNAWFRFKANAVRLFGIALALAGAAALLYAGAVVAWQKGGASLPEVPWLNPQAWLAGNEALPWTPGAVHIAIVVALLGLAAAAAGGLTAQRQTARLHAAKRRREDGLRRVREYRSDEARQRAYENRLEPFIGPDGEAGQEKDRRVA
jgi:hypothetical protein